MKTASTLLIVFTLVGPFSSAAPVLKGLTEGGCPALLDSSRESDASSVRPSGVGQIGERLAAHFTHPMNLKIYDYLSDSFTQLVNHSIAQSAESHERAIRIVGLGSELTEFEALLFVLKKVSASSGIGLVEILKLLRIKIYLYDIDRKWLTLAKKRVQILDVEFPSLHTLVEIYRMDMCDRSGYSNWSNMTTWILFARHSCRGRILEKAQPLVDAFFLSAHFDAMLILDRTAAVVLDSRKLCPALIAHDGSDGVIMDDTVILRFCDYLKNQSFSMTTP